LRRWLVGIPLTKKQGTHTPFHSRVHDGPPSFRPCQARRIDVVVIRAWSPFIVSGALHDFDSEKAEAPGTQRIMPSVTGF
jgi:hypothetical protein